MRGAVHSGYWLTLYKRLMHRDIINQPIERAFHLFILQTVHQLLSNPSQLIQLVIGPTMVNPFNVQWNLHMLQLINQTLCEDTDIEIGCAGWLVFRPGPMPDIRLSVREVPLWLEWERLEGMAYHWNVQGGKKVWEGMGRERWREWVEE